MTSQALDNPLQSLIAAAAKSQKKTAGAVTLLRQRQANATDAVVVLADVSDSMSEQAGTRQRIEVLREALSRVWPDLPQARLVAFAATPALLADPADLPPPAGSTALHFALELAGSFRPAKTLVISDGEPDCEKAALEAAEKITGVIDTIYCGPEGNRAAIEFLQKLARSTGGRCVVTPSNAGGTLSLLAPVRKLLLLKA